MLSTGEAAGGRIDYVEYIGAVIVAVVGADGGNDCLGVREDVSKRARRVRQAEVDKT